MTTFIALIWGGFLAKSWNDKMHYSFWAYCAFNIIWIFAFCIGTKVSVSLAFPILVAITIVLNSHIDRVNFAYGTSHSNCVLANRFITSNVCLFIYIIALTFAF